MNRQIIQDIIFLTRLLASPYLEKDSKKLIKEKINNLIREALK